MSEFGEIPGEEPKDGHAVTGERQGSQSDYENIERHYKVIQPQQGDLSDRYFVDKLDTSDARQFNTKLSEHRVALDNEHESQENNIGEKVGNTLDYILQHKDEFYYLTPDRARSGGREVPFQIQISPDSASDVDMLLDFLVSERLPQAFDYIASLQSTEDRKVLLGMIVDRLTLPRVTDSVRHLLQRFPDFHNTGLVHFSTEDDFQKMAKILIGVDSDDPRTFFTNLNDLYAQVDFENYPTNLKSQDREMSLLTSILRRTGKDDLTVVDMGCGTGRIANELARQANIGKVVGVDPSLENIQKAKEGDDTGKVEYIEGKLERPNLEKEEADAVIVVGRTLTHVRDIRELEKDFLTINKILKGGGIFVFDLPKNSQGDYVVNREKYAGILEDLHIPITREDAMQYYSRVVDSPDKGKSLYDRYVPDLDARINSNSDVTLREYLEDKAGFTIAEFTRSPIPGWNDAQNIYYVATKKQWNDPYKDIDEGQFENIDLMSLSNEDLYQLPPQKYAELLGKLVWGGNEEDVLKKIPVIAERVEKDLNIPIYEVRNDMKRGEAIRLTTQYTRFVFEGLHSLPDGDLLEKMYNLYAHENPLVSDFAVSTIGSFIRLDNMNRGTEEYKDLSTRFKHGLQELLTHIGDKGFPQVAVPLVLTAMADGITDLSEVLIHSLDAVDMNSNKVEYILYAFDNAQVFRSPGVKRAMEEYLETHKEFNEKYGNGIRRIMPN